MKFVFFTNLVIPYSSFRLILFLSRICHIVRGNYKFYFWNMNTSLCSSDWVSIELFARVLQGRLQVSGWTYQMVDGTSNYKYQNFSLGVWYLQSSEISSGSLHHCSNLIVLACQHRCFGFMSSHVSIPTAKDTFVDLSAKNCLGCIYKNPLRVGTSSVPACLQVISQVLSLTTVCLHPAWYAAWWGMPTLSI